MNRLPTTTPDKSGRLRLLGWWVRGQWVSAPDPNPMPRIVVFGSNARATEAGDA